MVIKTASPGIVVNEIDLTRGTADAITTNVGALVGPFQKGPVDEFVLVETEAELQRVYGDPTDYNYQYWYTASNFLEYGGVILINRVDDATRDRGWRLAGDVDPQAGEVAAWLSPVQGGVGPMTIAMLMENTVRAAELALDR